jgi:hypothetical protein
MKLITKNILILLLIVLLFTFCRNNKDHSLNDDKVQSESFEDFLARFICDTAFQIQRIKFPYTMIYGDYEHNKVDTIIKVMNEKEWKDKILYYDFIDLFKVDQNKLYLEDYITLTFLNLPESYQDTIVLTFKTKTLIFDIKTNKYQNFYDNGYIKYHFKLIHNQWFLVKEEIFIVDPDEC